MNPAGKFEVRSSKFEAACPRVVIGILLLLSLSTASTHAQETSPLPPPALTATNSVSPTPSPNPVNPVSPVQIRPSPVPNPTPSLLKKTGVKIQFLPPPMEGTISLGIYDHTGKLVRVLHRSAKGDEFVAALDGYITHWDGLDDAGQPLPSGRYSGRGYMVGSITMRPVAPPTSAPVASGSDAAPTASPSTTAPSPNALPSKTLPSIPPDLRFLNGQQFFPQARIRVGLVSNPLDRDRAGSAELSVTFDSKGSWLQLADGLPLKQISVTPALKWVAMGRAAPGEPLVVFQSDGAIVQEFVITKVSNMMAFDCGDFDFAGPAGQSPE